MSTKTPSELSQRHSRAEPGFAKRPFRAIFLVGFMGAGKTSVGQALAAVIGWRFVDLDARIVARTGRSVPEIFAQEGEARFREMETFELQHLLTELDTDHTVASLGGGAWVQPANVALLRDASLPVLHLDASGEELWQRCQLEHGTRPLHQNREDFHRLYESRRPTYQAGTMRIETQGNTVAEVAEHIQLLLGLARTNAST